MILHVDNYLCTSYVLFVDIFARFFNDFISMKFLIAMFLPASLFIQTSCLLTLKIFANLPVYCTLPDYCLGRNMPVSPFIPPSPSIWNSRVPEMYRFVKVKWIVGYSFDKSVWSVFFFLSISRGVFSTLKTSMRKPFVKVVNSIDSSHPFLQRFPSWMHHYAS